MIIWASHSIELILKGFVDGIFVNLGPKTFPFLTLGTGGSHDFQHPDIMDNINYNNKLENPRWPRK
jgi:hypothetical protein